MRTSIATVCISGSLEQKLAAIAGAGFDGIELFENDLVTSPMSPEDVVARSIDLGLTIDLYQPFRDFEGVSPDQLRRNLRRAEHKFDLMNRLGVDTILVCSNVATAQFGDDAIAVEQLAALADLAAKHGVRVAFEALAWGRYVSTYDHAWRLVQEVDHPALGVCLDSFHILSRGTDLGTIDSIPGEKIFFCQLADAPQMSLDVLSWSRHYRVFPGEGTWDLADFVARLFRAGYRGPLSLEVFNDVFRQGDPVVTARDARRSLVALEDAARDDLREPAADAIPDDALPNDALPNDALPNDLAGLPQVAATQGFSFIELQPGEGGAVDELLGRLGFGYRGRHKRKNSELWSSGGAHVIVNHDRTGETARIAAVGLEVPDVQRASERAVALRSDVLPRDRAWDEDVLHAIAAPDGTELYFSERRSKDATWLGEFGTPDDTPTAARQPTGITHIDHVALVQPWQRADEAILFYQSILGLKANDNLDLPGESGLVRSRSLVTADRRIRLALNVNPTHADSPDVYPNHIAFHTDDLVSTVTALRERGVPLLPIPQNYYDDLDARLELGSETIADLRFSDILYDRDEHGDFLHVYTEPVGQLMVEIVQRRGGYDGYGAVNAPVRLAAQRASVVGKV